MKNLTDFKRKLQHAVNTGQFVKSTIYNAKNTPVRTNEPAPVSVLQTNAFALKRQVHDSWTEFGKVIHWEFSQDTATKKMLDGSRIVFEFTAKP